MVFTGGMRLIRVADSLLRCDDHPGVLWDPSLPAVWLYFKNKKNAAKWNEPPMRFAEGQLPFVTIQLPIFNEQFVIDRLIDAVCKWSTHETGSRFRCWTIRTMRRPGWPRRLLSGMRADLPGWRRNDCVSASE